MVGRNTEQYSPSSPETNPNCVVVDVQDALHLNQVTLVLYHRLLLPFAAATISMISCSATDLHRVLCRTPTAARGWPSTFSCCSHSSSSSASSSTCSLERRPPAFECGRQAAAEAVAALTVDTASEPAALSPSQPSQCRWTNFMHIVKSISACFLLACWCMVHELPCHLETQCANIDELYAVRC